MPSHDALVGMALVALGMVLIPGPNMMYLVSRSVSQGYRAGLVSLIGTCTGFRDLHGDGERWYGGGISRRPLALHRTEALRRGLPALPLLEDAEAGRGGALSKNGRCRVIHG